MLCLVGFVLWFKVIVFLGFLELAGLPVFGIFVWSWYNIVLGFGFCGFWCALRVRVFGGFVCALSVWWFW